MGDWKNYSLKSLGEVITGKTPSKNNPEDWGHEMPFVTPSDYANYRKTANSSIRYLSKDGIDRLKQKILPPQSILVTCIGSDMGKVVMNENEVITNQQINSIVPHRKIIDNDFIYYGLVSMYEILRVYGSNGTAVPIVNKGDFENIEIKTPPLPEQKAIASVLSSLDDKIDLLHRQNKTLEAMAETFFRKWFVEEAREDWEELPLSKVLQIGIGRTPPRKEFHWFSKNSSDVKWVSIKDLATSGIFIFDSSEYLTSEAVDTFNIPIIPSDTVLLSFKMTVGRVGITTEPMLSNEAIAHFKFNEDTPFSKEYLYFYLKQFKYDALGSTSSIVTAINSSIIKDMAINIPDEGTMNNFRLLTEPLFKKIKANQLQIRTLEKLRDTLLPKLISGEVRVEYEN